MFSRLFAVRFQVLSFVVACERVVLSVSFVFLCSFISLCFFVETNLIKILLLLFRLRVRAFRFVRPRGGRGVGTWGVGQ